MPSVNELEEAELHALMLRGLSGDSAAHRQLLETLSGRFRTFFRNRLQNAAVAEDLVQETILAITRNATPTILRSL